MTYLARLAKVSLQLVRKTEQKDLNNYTENKSVNIEGYLKYKQDKLSRYLTKRTLENNELVLKDSSLSTPLGKPLIDKSPLDSSKQERKIIWSTGYKPYVKNGTESLCFKLHKKNGTSTYLLINSTFFNSLPSIYLQKKTLTLAAEGKVFNSGNSKNRQGFIFYDEDKKLEKYGKGYNCKGKLLGKLGKFRPLAKKVAEGKKVQGDDIIRANYELYEMDQLASH